jgi:hypothetical protein
MSPASCMRRSVSQAANSLYLPIGCFQPQARARVHGICVWCRMENVRNDLAYSFQVILSILPGTKLKKQFFGLAMERTYQIAKRREKLQISYEILSFLFVLLSFLDGSYL